MELPEKSVKSMKPRALRPMVGLFEMFRIGIGPSSSHTVGPMRAGFEFINRLGNHFWQPEIVRVQAIAFGSLAWTGKGHWTDKAMILGLCGFEPDKITPDSAALALQNIRQNKKLILSSGKILEFDPDLDIVFDRSAHPYPHPNAMRFTASDRQGLVLHSEVWYSVGGGFVEREGESKTQNNQTPEPAFDIVDANNLLEICQVQGLHLIDIALANEDRLRPQHQTFEAIDKIAEIMFECIDRGLGAEGELPGGLKVKRRAKSIYDRLERQRLDNQAKPDAAMQYLAAFAIAVNEENAAGNRIVTAPTNGAAGVVPAVLRYYRDFCSGADQQGVYHFFLAAGLIGAMIKRNASIAGAEVGCQGEIGSASAMAAAGLTAALGGTTMQIENAAEIAIEHHLGMTCDPVSGLVQIPCIERNAFGAIKAVSSASLALSGDGTHRVSLDQAIETMRQTGLDMKTEYRETSRGGLAVNVPEC